MRGLRRERAARIPSSTYGTRLRRRERRSLRWGQDGRTGGAGTSRAGEVSNLFGRGQQGASTACRRRILRVAGAFLSPGTVVRSRPLLGQAHPPLGRLLGVFAAACLVVVLPALGGESGQSAGCPEGGERASCRAVTLGRPRSVLARLAARGRRHAPRDTARRCRAARGHGARTSSHDAACRPGRRADLRAPARVPAAPSLRAGRT